MQQSFQTMVMVASAYAAGHGVTLVVDPEATTFATNGKTFHCPTEETLRGRFADDGDLETYLLGSLNHEIGHIQRTDFAFRKEWRRAYEGHEHAATAEFVGQAVEDAVMELGFCRSANGARLAILNLWELLRRDARERLARPATDALLGAAKYVFVKSRHAALQQQWSEDDVQMVRRQMGDIGQDAIATALDRELAAIPLAGNTAQAMAIASRALLAMGIQATYKGDAEKSSPPSPTVGEESANADQQRREPSPASAGDSAATDEAGHKTPGGEPGGQDPAPEAGEGGSSNAGGVPQAGPPDDPIGSEAAGGSEAPTDAGSSVPGGTPSDTEAEAVVVAPVPAEGEQKPTTGPVMGIALVPGRGRATATQQIHVGKGFLLKQEVIASSMMASAKLSHLLLAETQARTSFAKRGKVVGTRMWKLKTGNTTVFRAETPGYRHSTAIQVLLDVSDSMEDRLKQAILAAAFLPTTFELIPGLRVALHAFPGRTGFTIPVKGWDQRMDQSFDALASLRASGGTPLAEAIREIGPGLLAQRVDRRLIIVITDGLPANRATAIQQMNRLRSAGVAVLGIGIGLCIKSVIPDSRKVRGIDELTPALYGMMEKEFARLSLAA